MSDNFKLPGFEVKKPKPKKVDALSTRDTLSYTPEDLDSEIWIKIRRPTEDELKQYAQDMDQISSVAKVNRAQAYATHLMQMITKLMKG